MKRNLVLACCVVICFICAGCASSSDNTAAADIETLISAIDTENPDLSSMGDIREGYDRLSEKQKQLVKSYPDFEQFEETFVNQKLEEIHVYFEVSLVSFNQLSSKIMSAWSKALNTKHAEIDNAIATLLSGTEYKIGDNIIVSKLTAESFQSTLGVVNRNHDVISADFEYINRAFRDDDVLDALGELYSEYIELYNKIMNPSDSHIEYCAVINDIEDDIAQAQTLLDTIWPIN